MPVHVRLSVALAALLVAASAASAVAQPTKPIFGHLVPSDQMQGSLDFSAALTQGYDDNITADLERQQQFQPTPFQVSGPFTGLAPRMDFASKVGQFKVAATGYGEGRYYAGLGKAIIVSEAVGAGVATTIGKKTTISANESVVYAPAFLYRLFPDASAPVLGEVTAAVPNYALDTNSYAYSTSASVTHKTTRKIMVGVDIDYRYTTFSSNLDYSNAKSYAIAPRFSYDVTRTWKATATYTPTVSQYGDIRKTIVHTIHVGVAYDHALSLKRRTSFSIGVGPIIEQSWDLRAPELTERKLQDIGGDASFTRQFTKTWSVRTSVHRGVEFTEVIAIPIITNGATVAVGGRVAPRTELQVSGSYSSGGTLAFGTPAHLDTSAIDTNARVSLTRQTALTIEYLRYQYTLSHLQPLVFGIPSDLTRNSFRIGIHTGVPIWKH